MPPPPPPADRLIDPAAPGTAEDTWCSAIERRCLPTVEIGVPGRTRSARAVVVSPHPDDEVLGAGGLIRHLIRRGWAVELLAVTDGEAAFGPPDPALARRRTRELDGALDRLCADLSPSRSRRRPAVEHLELPDGDVAVHAERLEAAVARRLVGASLCVGPWPGDGHPDHEATGSAVERAAIGAGVPLLRYPVWLWHWGDPERDLPWADCRRLDLDDGDRRAKRRAVQAFASQRGSADAPAILTPAVLTHFRRATEVFVA